MRVGRLLMVFAGFAVLLAVPSVAAANTHTFWRSSATDQQWVDPIAHTAGLSVLSVPNIGCNAVDQHGYCTAGLYPTRRGAHWIWEAAETDPANNTSDYGPVMFVRRIDVPNSLGPVHGKLQITADNEYDVWINGVHVGTGADWSVIDSWSVPANTLQPGPNWMVIEVTNFAGPMSAFENPAALLYKLKVTYTT